jgi:hypothetical protein
VVDNTDAGFSVTGAWPASTSVAGFAGADYQTHEPDGAAPGSVVVDNADAGFSTVGTWSPSGSVKDLSHFWIGGAPRSLVHATWAVATRSSLRSSILR